MAHALFDLTGGVALVTGSGSGLGFAIARGLAQAGATVVLNGRDRAKLDRAVAALKTEDLTVASSVFDVTKKRSIDAGVEAIEREVGPVSILVNNAGVMRRAPLAEIEEAAWREVLDTDLTGVFLVSQSVARRMIARRQGKIMNICSLMSEVGRPTTGAYTAAKGGLKMLTKAMALEWAPHNIQVNGIGPGYFETDMTRPLMKNAEFDAWVRKRTPAGRWGRPDDLVGAAVFLAAPASDFVTGQIIYVDGGILATL